MGDKPAHKNKSPLRKGLLCAAFALALLCTPGSSAYMGTQDEPTVVTVFNMTAVREPPGSNPTQWNLTQMHQDISMKIPGNAAKYNAYMAQFDQFKNMSLLEMADGVNTLVLQQIKYTSDMSNYHLPDYWATPLDTIARRKGDCEDFAILQYYILRHLGVPDDRLFIATVSTTGKTNDMDHVVLLLNLAPKGAKEDFLVLNDSNWVMYSSLYDNANTLPSGWSKPYILYEAMNEGGYWETKYSTWFADVVGGKAITVEPSEDGDSVQVAITKNRPVATPVNPSPKKG